jgi:hypothetical protein
VVPGQDWCSLCLQPLRAAPAQQPDQPGGAASPAPDRAGLSDPDDPAGVTDPAGVIDPAGVVDPAGVFDPADPYASAAGAAGPRPAGDLPGHVAEAMLAELAATAAADRPLGRGPLAGTSRGVRLALGCGAAVVLGGVLVLVVTLVGLLL